MVSGVVHEDETVESPDQELNVTRRDLESCRVRLDIEVPLPRVQAAFAAALAAVRTSARLPGFRPGKAPAALVQRRFRKEIEEDVKQKLMAAAVEEACKLQNLTMETTPRLEDAETVGVAADAPLLFSVSFDTPPEFALPEYKGIRVLRSAATVDEDSVQVVIDRFLQQRASFNQVERPAAAGDLLKVTYHGVLQDEAQDVPENARFMLDAEETWLALRPPEILPGSTAALEGAEPGTARELEIVFPDDYPEAALQGRRGQYTFQVLEVHAASVPEFTDDIAREIGAENTGMVRDRVRQNLAADRARQQQQAAREQVVQTLLDQLDFPVPPAMLARETHQTVGRLVEQELREGRTDAQIREQQADLVARAQRLAALQLKRRYVLGRIADQEKIEIKADELRSTIDTVSAYNRVTPKVAQRRLRESGRLGDLVIGIREAKTIDRLLELAEFVDSEPAATGTAEE